MKASEQKTFATQDEVQVLDRQQVRSSCSQFAGTAHGSVPTCLELLRMISSLI